MDGKILLNTKLSLFIWLGSHHFLLKLNPSFDFIFFLNNSNEDTNFDFKGNDARNIYKEILFTLSDDRDDITILKLNMEIPHRGMYTLEIAKSKGLSNPLNLVV